MAGLIQNEPTPSPEAALALVAIRMDLEGERVRWENPFAQECLAI